MKKDEPFEEELEWEKKKQPKGREAGIGSEGELSAAALKGWFLWAGLALGICLILGVILTVISNGRNQKEAAWMEVDFGETIEIRLNRKGGILEAGEGGEELVGKSLERGLYGLFDLLSERGQLPKGNGFLITVRASDSGLQADIGRFVDEIEVYAETGLKKKQSDNTIYVAELIVDEEIRDMSEEYGISISRAAFIKGLIDRNTSLKLRDESRLAGLSLRELIAETLENKYNSSFDAVTAKKIYGKKADETETTKEVPESPDEAEESDSEAAKEEALGEETAEVKIPEADTQKAENGESGTFEETDAWENENGTFGETDAQENENGTSGETDVQGNENGILGETDAQENENGTLGKTDVQGNENRTSGETDTQGNKGGTSKETDARVSESSTEAEAGTEETTAAMPTVTPITPATVPTEPEPTVPASTAAPLEVLPISPETSPEAGTVVPQTETTASQESVQVHEVVPVSPGNTKGPGY